MAFNPGDSLDLYRDIEPIGRFRLRQCEANSPIAALGAVQRELRRFWSCEPWPEEGVERTPSCNLEGVTQITPSSDTKLLVYPEALNSSTKCLGTDFIAKHEEQHRPLIVANYLGGRLAAANKLFARPRLLSRQGSKISEPAASHFPRGHFTRLFGKPV